MMAVSLLLLQMALQPLLSRRTLKAEYAPYGPKMCKDHCVDSVDSFIYVKDNLTCKRIPYIPGNRLGKNSHEYPDICLKNDRVVKGSCVSNYEDESRFNLDFLDRVWRHENDDVNLRPHDRFDGKVPEVISHQNSNAEETSKSTYSRILHQACYEGDLCLVRHLVTRRLAGINSRGKNGRTPIMSAAWKSQVAVVDYLLSQNCDLTAVDIYNDNLLHVACIVGSIDIVRNLIVNESRDKEKQGKDGATPLLISAYHGHRNVFDFLVTTGCNTSATDIYNNSVIHMGCGGGHVDFVKYILSLGTYDKESKGKYGRTPLLIAASRGHIDVLELLVTRGCNISKVDIHKNAMIHVASINGRVEMVQYILDRNICDIESKGHKGKTAVLSASLFGNRGVVKLLIERGCNVNATEASGKSIVHLACWNGHVNIVTDMFNSSCLESRDYDGMTPLLIAAYRGHLQIMKFLLSKGSNRTAVDRLNNTILHVACYSGQVDVVKYILDKDLIDIESGGYSRRTPLLTATVYGHRAVVNLLIHRGCSLLAVSKNGKTLLHTACFGGHVDMVKHVMSLGVIGMESRDKYGRTPLMIAAVSGHKGVMQFLLSKGSSLTAVDKLNNTILHQVCVLGLTDMASYIIEEGLIDIESKGLEGSTPVLIAAAYNQREVLDILIGKHCNLKAVDNNGNNILHVACNAGNVDMVKYILSKNIVGKDSRTYNGLTPLLVASRRGNTRVVALLQSRGCNLKAVSKSGYNVLHLAILSRSLDLMRYLISQRAVNLWEKNKNGLTPEKLAKSKGYVRIVHLFE